MVEFRLSLINWGNKKLYAAHISLVFVQLIFSGWHILGSVTLKDGADPLVFALYREISASLLMYGLVLYLGVKLKVYSPDYIRFIGLGIASFVNVVGTVLALQYISASRYALYQPSIPCIATLISILLQFESFTWLKAIGIAFAVGGAVTVEAWKSSSSSSSSSNHESNINLGTTIVLTQCFAMACIIVFQKPLLRQYQPSFVTFIYYSIGSCITVLLCICWEFKFTPTMFYFDGLWLPWVALAYAAIFATLINYNIYSYVGKLLSPSIITIYSTFQPVGTVIMSILFLGDLITMSEVIGGILVIIGLVITVYARQKEILDRRKEKQNNRDTDIFDISWNESMATESTLSKNFVPFSGDREIGNDYDPSTDHSYHQIEDLETFDYSSHHDGMSSFRKDSKQREKVVIEYQNEDNEEDKEDFSIVLKDGNIKNSNSNSDTNSDDVNDANDADKRQVRQLFLS